MNTITKNFYDILFWGAFITLLGLGVFVFGTVNELVSTISAM